MVNCPICKHNKTRRYFSNKFLTLFYCGMCKVKFQHPMPTPEFLNKIYSAEYYNSFYPERILGEQKLLFSDRLKKFEGLRSGKKGKLLDIGSGRGVFLEEAKGQQWECVGQEFSREAAIDIKKRLGIDVVVCEDFSKAGFDAESFDLVNMNHVLEHLYDPLCAVQEIYRVLKHGGFFYCEVPRQNNLLNFLSNIFGKKDFGFTYLPEHLFLFDKFSLGYLLKYQGFDIFEIKIEGLGDRHRYVREVHYNSFWTHIVVKVVGSLKLQIPLGGGNLIVIGRKPFRK